MRIPSLVLAITALAFLCFVVVLHSRMIHLETMNHLNEIETQILKGI